MEDARQIRVTPTEGGNPEMPWRFRPRVGPWTYTPAHRRSRSVLGSVLSAVFMFAVVVVWVIALVTH
jgi:hypothetical protein